MSFLKGFQLPEEIFAVLRVHLCVAYIERSWCSFIVIFLLYCSSLLLLYHSIRSALFFVSTCSSLAKIILQLYIQILKVTMYSTESNGNIRNSYVVCLKLPIKTSEWRQWSRPGVFIGNFEQISHLFLMFPCWLWTSKC